MNGLNRRNTPHRSPGILCGAFLAFAASGSLAWNASGTVKSAGGSALADVAVTVKDSAASTVTNVQGVFSLGSVTGIRNGAGAGWNVQVVGDDLLLRAPLDGDIQASLFDGAGRQLWNASSRLRAGEARLRLPSLSGASVAYLRIRHPDGELVQAVTIGTRGLELPAKGGAEGTAAGRVEVIAPAAYPTLVFKKNGYQDTSYAMKSQSETGIAVAMRDTSGATTCPTTRLSAGDHRRTLNVKGASRSYILHVPSGYAGTSAVPLVVDFHPLGGSGQNEENASPYKAVTDPEGVVTAYPDGIMSPTNLGAWNVGPCCTTADDTAFARAIVADAKAQTCINPKRVYAVGFSMGGGMTHYSACHLSDVFAATAPAAFDLLKENQDACKPSRPLTMVLFRSTGDGVVLYNGGFSEAVTGMPINFLGAKASFAKWASIDQCTGSPSAEDANGCSTYSSCAGGVQVTLCTKQGGGHDYGNASVGWPILKKYTLP